jgi:hypothetical protein
VAHPWLIPAKTRAALAGPNGQLLVAIATAPGLGAPDVSAKTAANVGAGTAADAGAGTAAAGVGASGSSPPLTTAIADAAGSGPGLALLGVLALIVGAVAGAAIIRHRRSSI